jgi:hypothetical protein
MKMFNMFLCARRLVDGKSEAGPAYQYALEKGWMALI